MCTVYTKDLHLEELLYERGGTQSRGLGLLLPGKNSIWLINGKRAAASSDIDAAHGRTMGEDMLLRCDRIPVHPARSRSYNTRGPHSSSSILSNPLASFTHIVVHWRAQKKWDPFFFSALVGIASSYASNDSCSLCDISPTLAWLLYHIPPLFRIKSATLTRT